VNNLKFFKAVRGKAIQNNGGDIVIPMGLLEDQETMILTSGGRAPIQGGFGGGWSLVKGQDGYEDQNFFIKTNDVSKKVFNKTYKRKKGSSNMFEFAKGYLEEHKESIMTIAFVVVLDQIFLGGALRDRIKRLIEGLLDRSEAKLLGGSAPSPTAVTTERTTSART